MVFFAGMRGTGSYGTGERPQNFREMILRMNPNGSAPLFALTSKSKDDPTDDPQFHWWEELDTICRLKVNGALDDNPATTTVVVDDGALQLIPGDILYVEPATEVAAIADEYLRVVSVSSDTTFVVQRAAAGSTIAAIANDLFLLRVGNAQSEGNLSPSASSTNPTKLTNYTQIFKTPYQITKTDLKTKHRTGDPLKNEQIRKTFIHSEKIEQSLFWGRASESLDAANGNQPLRTTGGLRQFITSNVTIFSADPTVSTFMDAVSTVFDYDAGGAGNERLAFAGNGALNFLNTMIQTNASTNINYDGTINAWGMRLNRLVLPQGTLAIKAHPLMSVHPVYRYGIFIVNPAGIRYRPLRGRDTHIEKNIQPNDADYVKDQWLTEAGFEFHHERTHAYLGQVRDHA